MGFQLGSLNRSVVESRVAALARRKATEPESMVLAAVRGADVALVNPADHPGQPLFIPGDGHPTGLLDRIWAQQVKDIVYRDFGAASWR